MTWLQVFDFSKKIGFPEIFSITISTLALGVAALSLWNSVETRRQALPAVNVETILEGYCGFRRRRTAVPIEDGQLFRSIADSIPMIADSCCRRRFNGVMAWG